MNESTPRNVRDYRTGDLLDGSPDQSLVDESLAAAPTGAVEAYRNGDVWRPAGTDAAYLRRQGYAVVTVYVV